MRVGVLNAEEDYSEQKHDYLACGSLSDRSSVALHVHEVS